MVYFFTHCVVTYSRGSEEAGGQDWAVPSHYRSAPLLSTKVVMATKCVCGCVRTGKLLLMKSYLVLPQFHDRFHEENLMPSCHLAFQVQAIPMDKYCRRLAAC